ncbi:MAG TPA: protein phosphatase 2C domain-containing protein [Polyangiales bacterium]
MSGAPEDQQSEPLEASDTVVPAPNPASGAATSLPSFSGPGVRVRYTGRSAVGLVREHNEDNLVIADLSSGEVSAREQTVTGTVGKCGVLFAVCDGMGGAAAGEVASQMAVEILLEAMRRGGSPKDRDELARRLVSSVEEAGRRIFESAQKERSRRGMGTTATVAVLVDKLLFLAEVGDSRAYLLRRGVLKQLTKDQSLVNQLIEAGHLTEAEAEAFEHSNIILQALGTAETVQVDLTFVELRKGDRLMMCSDGLSGLVHADTIRDALSTIEDPCEATAALVKYAEAGGGHDNITVLVIDFDGDDLDGSREADSFGYVQYPLLPAGSVATFGDEEVTDAGAQPAAAASSSSTDSDALPLAADTSDRGSWLWISAGVVALIVGAWVLAVSGSEKHDSESVATGMAHEVAPSANPNPAEVAAPDPKPVPVRVFSDVQGATLLVNGEARGALASGEGRNMELRPGAYRFEAQSNGNIAAVEVVTVRPDVPLDVYLKLPSGASDTAPKELAPKAAEPAGAMPTPSAAPREPAAKQPVAAPEPKPRAEAPKAEAARATAAELVVAPAHAPAAAQPAPSKPSAAAAAPAPAGKPEKLPDNPF